MARLIVNDRDPVTAEDVLLVGEIETVAASAAWADASPDAFRVRLDLMFLRARDIRVGRGGHHVWVSRRVDGSWHRLCMVVQG